MGIYFHDLVRMLDIIQCELLTSQLILIVAFLSKYAKLTSMYKPPVLPLLPALIML